MKCSDTVLAFFIFFTFWGNCSEVARQVPGLQLFIRSKIPLGSFVPFGGTMKKPWFLTLTRVQGIILMGFGLFLLAWHVRHCG